VSLAAGFGAAHGRDAARGADSCARVFNRDPVTVGRELLGKLLIRREGRKLLAGRIVEDEAYLAGKIPRPTHSPA